MIAPTKTMEILHGGPAFGLTMELGPGGRARLSEGAWEAFWDCASINGPWTDPVSLGDENQRIKITSPITSEPCCYGLLRIQGVSEEIPFSAYTIVEESWGESDNLTERAHSRTLESSLSDWITIDIPVAVLAKFFPLDNSWRVATQSWLLGLCAAFASLADHVHSTLPIWSGAIGEEISGAWRRPSENRRAHAVQDYPPLALMSADVVNTRGGVLLPQDLWDELRPTVSPVVLPSGLLYVAPRPSASLLGA